MSHIIADAFTLAIFVNEWAHVCQTGTLKVGCLLSFDRLHSLFPPIGSITQFLVSPSDVISSGPYKIFTKRFVFNVLAITNLKNTIKDLIRPTRVVVVMSLIWKVLIGISNELSKELPSISFAINLRGKSKIPSLDHALGKCTTIEIVNAEAKKEELNELLGNKIQDTCSLIGKATSVDEISSLIVSNLTKLADKFLQGGKINDVYPITTWCRFPWYEADFGWRKPFWVSSVSYNVGESTILMDTKNGDGIEAWVTLKENVMVEFERDPQILSYTSNHPFLDLDKIKL